MACLGVDGHSDAGSQDTMHRESTAKALFLDLDRAAVYEAPRTLRQVFGWRSGRIAESGAVEVTR